MRLFVAAVPPDPVLDDLVAAIDRLRPDPDATNLRWAGRDQLHVTLRFLGDVPDVAVPDVIDRLAAAPLVRAQVTLGPEVARLGRQVLVVRAAGLDALAGAVTEATADLGQPPDPRPFTGHVTLARAGRRGVVARSLTGTPIAASWDVADIRLVRSHLGSGGPRYDDLYVRPLEA